MLKALGLIPRNSWLPTAIGWAGGPGTEASNLLISGTVLLG